MRMVGILLSTCEKFIMAKLKLFPLSQFGSKLTISVKVEVNVKKSDRYCKMITVRQDKFVGRYIAFILISFMAPI